MKTPTALTAAVVLSLAACASVDPLPQGATNVAAPAPVTTCDAVREAFLTGTPKQVDAAIAALIKDTTAPAEAREAAKDWKKTKDTELRDILEDTVTLTCSLE